MRKNLLTILLILVSMFVLQSFVISVSIATEITNTKNVEKEMDIHALIDRINVLIETNQKQLSIVQSQEKEIQRLNTLIESLRKELDATKTELESVKAEKNTVKLEASEIRKKISDLVAQIIAESMNIRIASEKMLESIKQKDTAIIKQESNFQSNKSLSQPNEVKSNISPQNEKLMESLANAAVTTGQTVHIQYGGDVITGSPVGDRKCEADVTITKNGLIVMQKKYNLCN